MNKQDIKIATVSLHHHGMELNDTHPQSQDSLLREAEPLLLEACKSCPDFVVLPEYFGSFGIPAEVISPKVLAERVPGGKIFSFLSNWATRYQTHIVTSVLERDDDGLFNCGILIDRFGRLVGKYRKVHLAPCEVKIVRPGNDFPVFETEGVRCGILICFDLNFPEAARTLALQGVDIIFWPTMWGIPSEDPYYDAILRARAGENLCFLASAALVHGPPTEIHGRSCVVSWNSQILAEVGPRVGVTIASIDLTRDRRIQGRRDDMLGTLRRPECYGKITCL